MKGEEKIAPDVSPGQFCLFFCHFFKPFGKNEKCWCPKTNKNAEALGVSNIAVFPKIISAGFSQIPYCNACRNAEEAANKTDFV